MCKQESIPEIASSINDRAIDEVRNSHTNRAIARCFVQYQSTSNPSQNGGKIFFLINKEQTSGYFVKDWLGQSSGWVSNGSNTSTKGGKSVYKNTKLGELLTKYWNGKHQYVVMSNEVTVEILNKSTYHPSGNEVIDLEIRLAESNESYKYAALRVLIESNAKQQKQLEEKREKARLLEEEKKQREKEECLARERARQEELDRLEQERIQREEEAAKELADIHAEIERLELSMDESNKKINTIKSFLRTGIALRSQHLLDEYQEDAKRSHLYDGTTIVIDGGPGTGKTTTTIQRLKFLLSKEALNEYETSLTPKQIDYLTDPVEWNNRWLFFSPTDLLLQYLRNNMAQEDLIATDSNTRTLDRFRSVQMRNYGLFNPASEGPFKNYKASAVSKLILSPKEVILSFEQFCIDYVRNAMNKRVALKTSDYGWHDIALSIKATYQNYRVNNIDDLMRMINALSDRDKSSIKSIESQLRELLNNEAIKVKRNIMSDTHLVEQIHNLFTQWERERLQLEEEDSEEDVVTSEEEEEISTMESFNQQNFEAQLYATSRKLLRKLGLRKYDSKSKLSKRDLAFYDLVNSCIDGIVDVNPIGELALFTKNFASMCRGIESCLINQIPRMYKAFRKQQLDDNSTLYNIELLDSVINKDNNKYLHADEQNLLIGFLNNLFYRIYKQSKNRFNELKGRYAVQYKESTRPVIGIDEATDYSILDYYFMVSFRHYEFSSITLCGDIMQGLNSNGIEHWSDLQDFIFPNLEVKSLNISYRQLPTLVEVSREMYKDDQGTYPNYKSEHNISPDEPSPQMFISEDEEEKAIWISNQIVKIYQTYGTLPSVAIFVGEEVDITKFIKRFEDLDMLNGIEIVDCSGGKKLDSKEVVRVFRLSEVKGMEFEAVFFYDIDKAIEGHSAKIMRRYLYVGVSRATSHLAATISSKDGNEDIIKYFNVNSETLA